MALLVTITRNGATGTIPCADWANAQGVVGYALKKLVKEDHASMLIQEFTGPERTMWFAGEDWAIFINQGDQAVTHALTSQDTNTTVVTDTDQGDET